MRAKIFALAVIALLGFFFISSSYPSAPYSYPYRSVYSGWSYSNVYYPSYYSAYYPAYGYYPQYRGYGGAFLRFW